MRIGIGYDIHAFGRGRALVLGGVRIPHSRGLRGHSDGDALFHAVLDAVLGAMGEGDLGEYFPDTSPAWKGASSRSFAKKIHNLLKKKKLRVAHIDSTVIAEEPRLGPYKEKIRRSLAVEFRLPLTSVGVKAKTNEGFGPVGEKKAIACWAVASVTKSKR